MNDSVSQVAMVTALPYISLGLTILFFWACRKSIVRHPRFFHGGTILIWALIFYMSGTSFARDTYYDYPLLWFLFAIFKRGAIGTSVFMIIMLVGPLKDLNVGQWFVRTFYPIRRQMAIIGSFLVLLHNFIYGQRYFVLLLTDPSAMKTKYIFASLFSLAAIIILIPLCITSFERVRNKMSFQKWKSIQKWAYAYYWLVFLHVVTMYSVTMTQVYAMGSAYVVKYALGIVFYVGVYGYYGWLLYRRNAQTC